MRAVVCDLDGTLVDSADDIVASVRHALGLGGNAVPDAAEVRAWIGRPLPEILAHYAPAADIPALVEAYRAHYWEHCTDRTRVFDGVPEALTALRRDGWRIAVATAKRTDLATHVCATVGLGPLVDRVQGIDGLPGKPAPDVVLAALAGLEVAPSRASWMVGDTTDDVAAGRAAGLSTLGVTTGTHDRTTLEAAGADLVAERLDAILEQVRR